MRYWRRQRSRWGRRSDERLDSEAGGSNPAILLSAFAVLVSVAVGIAVLLGAGDDGSDASASAASDTEAAGASTDWEDIDFESYKQPDPELPASPPGPVKEFDVDVFEHVTQVSAELPPIRVWSFGVNGTLYRGTGASPPLVVTEGDQVKINLVNGSSKAMNVTAPHSIDFHSSEVAPNVAFVTIAPGEKHSFSFVAKHPGVFMYHCATDPVLLHTGAGMAGMMVVKPKDLAPVDRELWVTQQEFFPGEPGEDPDMAKMEAHEPDVIAFNGYAAQYKENPIAVKRGERIRMFVMNAGPSEWSAFHVIGTVFDRTVIEGVVSHDTETVNLAPSQGGWVEFTLDREGTFPFVTHAFADMVKGAVGVLETENADTSGSH